MPLQIVRNDITKITADAIINPANEDLLEGSGTSRAIFLAAGEDRLTAACKQLGHCDEGDAVATPAFDLKASYILHAVGPVWLDGNHGEAETLAKTYRSALQLAWRKKCRSAAFPLLSAGNYRFPKEAAFQVALSAIGSFLLNHEMTVYLVLYDGESVAVSKKLYASIDEYIDDRYVDNNDEDLAGDESYSELRYAQELCRFAAPAPAVQSEELPAAHGALRREAVAAPAPPRAIKPKPKRSLESLMKDQTEGFSQMLFRLIDERGMKDSEVYKRANLSRQHFSKIRSNLHYNPKKSTVLALAVALRLSLDETTDLLQRAGFALTDSSKRDIIVRYFIENGMHKINEINLVLYEYEQEQLGC